MLIFYMLPFAAMLIASLNVVIGAAFTVPIKLYILFVFIHLLFMLSLSAVIGNILIETALSFFEDVKNSPELRKINKDKNALPIKSLVFVIIFAAFYIYLGTNTETFTAAKLLIMILPSVAFIVNSKYFNSGKVRYISGKYLTFNKKFKVMISHTLTDDNKIEFITVEGEPFETNVVMSDVDYKAFCEECRKNGLNAPNIGKA